MHNSNIPEDRELPSTIKLLKSALIAALCAIVLLVTVVLPAEYGVDPTGIGKVLGLKEMGEIKAALAAELAADNALHAGEGHVHGPDTHTHDNDGGHVHGPDTHTHDNEAGHVHGPDTHTHDNEADHVHGPDTHTHDNEDDHVHGPDTHTHDNEDSSEEDHVHGPDTHTH